MTALFIQYLNMGNGTYGYTLIFAVAAVFMLLMTLLHAVSGALCLGAACLIPGTVAFDIANIGASATNPKTIIIEHPSGYIETKVTMVFHDDGAIGIPEASFVRTARPLSEGKVFVPEHIIIEGLKQQSVNDESNIVTETKLRARM